MEGILTSKRKRVYSFEPNAMQRVDFLHKYIHYLLPALFQIGKDRTRGKIENEEIEKKVRFEVDMALVFSASEFSWSHALKHKLEQDHMNTKSLLNIPTHPRTSLGLLLSYKHENYMNSPLPPLPRPLFHVGSKRDHRIVDDSDKLKKAFPRPTKKRSRNRGGDDEIGRQLMTLRRILPGGDEVKMSELISEVKSYIVCLELQVGILGTLVDIH